MKAKVNRGNGFRGMLNYALGDSKKHEIVGGNMSGQTPRELAAEFKVSRQLRPGTKNPVVQFSLSLPPGEDVPTEKWSAIVDDFITEMKLDGHQYVAIKHNDTDHKHAHIVASRIGLDGVLWHGQWEAFKAIDATQKLEVKHGLTITPGLDSVDDEKHKKKLTTKEVEMAIRTGEAPARQVLQNLIDEASTDQPSVVAFMQRLEAAGVTVLPNVASTGKLNGFSFEYQGIPFKGSALGKSYAWKGLQQRGITYDQDRESGELISRKEQAGAGKNTDREASPGSDSRPGAVDVSAVRTEHRDIDVTAESHQENVRGSGQVDQDVDSKSRAGSTDLERRGGSARTSESAFSEASSSDSQLDRLRSWESVSTDAASLAAGASEVIVDTGVGAGNDSVSKALKSKQDAWNRQSDGLSAPSYRITMKGRKEGLPTYNMGKSKDGTEHFYSKDEVTNLLPKLSRENARGFDVYVTPIDGSHHYIVIDDMRDESMKQLRADGFEPCIVQQSSHDNWQAIIKIRKDQREQSQANDLVVDLNKRYGDPNFSGVVHPFRMAGFSNKKPGRNNAFTQVREAVNRICSKASEMLTAIKDRIEKASARTVERFDRERLILVASTAPGAPRDVLDAFRRGYAKHTGLARSAGWNIDDSRLDWAVTIDLLKAGYDRNDVAAALLSASPSVLDRHNDPRDYADRTVSKAWDEPDVVKARAMRSTTKLFEKEEQKQTLKKSVDNNDFSL